MSHWYKTEDRKPIKGRWFIGKPVANWRSDIPPYIAYQMHEQTPINDIKYWTYIPEEDYD